jgi:WD40 repeat protein
MDLLKAENMQLRREADALRKALSKAQTGQTGGDAAGIIPGMGAPQAEGAFQLQRTIAIHNAPVHSVAMATHDINNDGQLKNKVVATASWDATIKLYDLERMELVKTFGDVEAGAEGKMQGLYAVAWAKTAPEILGCTCCDHNVYLWDHTSGKLLKKLPGHSDEVNGIDFHPSQQVMCTASDDCKVIIWDFHEGIKLRMLDKHTKQVYGTTFLGQEMQYNVATCCFDRQTRIFDMRDKTVVALLKEHTDDVIGIDYSGSKQLLATGSDDGIIALWDTRTWKLQDRINTKADPSMAENEVKRVAFSSCGNLLAAACSSGYVLVYDITGNTSNLAPLAQLGGHTDCVFDVTWGLDAAGHKTLVSASHDHTCRYWRSTNLI